MGFAMKLHGIELHVSPTGSDGNSGMRGAPLATLAVAQQKVRSYAGTEPVTVHVAEGIYYLPETLMFTAQDSGSAKYPVLYKAVTTGGVILSGGSQLKLSWEPYRDGIFQAKTAAGLEIDQLFIDGENQRMARYPNYDPNKKAKPYQGYSADAFSKERTDKWADPAGAYIHAMHSHKWGGYHYKITGKDANGEVTYEGGWQNNRQMGMHKNYRMVENVFEELDAEGEWFHDAKNNTLYYKPVAGTNLSAAKVEVVRLRHLIELQGSEQKPVKNLSFQGFVVRHAARTFMDTKEPLLRSDWTVYRGGAFMLTGTENVSILDCEFDQIGGNAIFVNKYNRGTVVKGCHIHDAGASGVCFVGDPNAVHNPLFEYGERQNLSDISRSIGPKTNNYPADSIVEDCLIHGIGRVERQPAGVQISMAHKITVRDCSIYDTARAGINISEGTWGGHLIERCDVFDTVLETGDHGSFNSWGRDRYWKAASQQELNVDKSLPFLDAIDTTIIRDSRWRCDHGWDIDLDDGSTNYDIYNNLMLNGGLKLREGFRRRAWNNITVNNSLSPHVWYENSDDELYANIWMGPYRGVRVPTETVRGKKVDGNLFFRAEPLRIDGWDETSIVADPLFVDPASGDYRVQDDSPALGLGFKNFPMDQFGVKKPSLKAIARTPALPTIRTSIAYARDKLKKAAAPADVIWMGAKLHSLKGQEFSAYGVSAEDGGVALVNVPANSEAAKQGLKANDVIQAINGGKVSNVDQFDQALSAFKTKVLQLELVRAQQPMALAVSRQVIVNVERASSPTGFKKFPVPPASGRTVTAKPNTNNDPLNTLTDGKLAKSFGPVFGNRVFHGMYKMDLGAVKLVEAVTSWSYNMGNARAAQKLTVFGSNAKTDPGWDLSRFKSLGSIDTGEVTDMFSAASLQGVDGQALGNFRWIVWVVQPVTTNGGGENTAFQELAVSIVGEAQLEALVKQPNKGPAKLPGKRSDFKGYDCYEFRINNNRTHIKIVCPENAATGKPWLWRNLFWEAIGQVNQADLQLVEEGYHVVVVHGHVSGHPSGNVNIDAAYDLVTSEYGFAKTCSAYSLSRGNLQVFQWAAANPEKVSSIVVDNGVCNIRSWPAGKVVPGSGSVAPGAPSSWAGFKKAFGYETDAEALVSKESPIEKLEPLAKAGVAILSVCGRNDGAVLYEENDKILEERYKALGGDITLIVHEKGHSHGMKDPTPVLEFIKKHTPPINS